jgi:uncharacterized protein YbbC (DUF1343 family)
MRLGVERLVVDAELRARLAGRRVAVLGHPASVDAGLTHTLDLLAGSGLTLSAAFGPQHGMRGDKQDNMVETPDAFDARLGVPVFSLYGAVRRPTPEMLATFDVLLVDLQDLGTRIYTFLTTLLYVLEAAAQAGKEVWVLDRPNPIGRPVEGAALRPGYESFVGAMAGLPMRHGLTLGEAARLFVGELRLDVALEVVPMDGWDPSGPGFGQPLDRVWVNPSPNAARLNMARCYPGTVLLEGTTLSEGRGTTTPLEVVGAPDLDVDGILAEMARATPSWITGCIQRPCWFEPTFHKHVGRLCAGVQVHADFVGYRPESFRPYRWMAAFFKALRAAHPAYDLWRNHPYEYTEGLLPIDVIDGGPGLRTFVDDPRADVAAFDAALAADEAAWIERRAPYLLYPA